jgi:hypothetical protein
VVDPFLKIIGEVVVGQQQEIAFGRDAFPKLESFIVDVELFEVIGMAGSIDLYILLIDFNVPDIEDGPFRVVIIA